MPEEHGGVRYEHVGDAYFDKRGLRRFARVWSLWALGVGAVISGDFFGWSFGLAEGGFGGMLIATVVITVMYLGLCYSIAEMSPALPHTGGAYSFARSAMGPWGGYVTGLAENMEYILTPAVIVAGIGSYLGAVFGTPESFAPGVVGGGLCLVRGAQHLRRRGLVSLYRVHHLRGFGNSRRILYWCYPSPRLRFPRV